MRSVACIGLLCGCADVITVGKQNTDDIPADGPPNGAELSIGCNETTRLKPVAARARLASEVVPGAKGPCQITLDPAGLLLSACASSVPTAVGVDALPSGQSQELFVRKRARDATSLFRTPIAGIAALAFEVAATGDAFVIGSREPASDANSEYSLVRLGPRGEIAWQQAYYKMYDGANASAALRIAADGTLWVTGSTNFVAAQFDASGVEQQKWSFKHGGDPGWGAGEAIRILDNGDVLIAGVLKRPTDFGGGVLGEDTDTQPSGFLVRYSASGEYLTGQVFAPSGGVKDVGLASGLDGGVLLTANLNGGSLAVFDCVSPNPSAERGFIAKLDKQLSVEWATFISARVFEPAVDAQGNINLPIEDPDGVYFATLDATGTTGTTRASSAGSAPARHVALGPAGLIYVSGAFVGSVAFGAAPLTADGQAAYLLSIEP
jgi:hypothetical protein